MAPPDSALLALNVVPSAVTVPPEAFMAPPPAAASLPLKVPPSIPNVPPEILIAPPFCEAVFLSKFVPETEVVPPVIFKAPPFCELNPLKLNTSLIERLSPSPTLIPPILAPFARIL